MLGASPGADRGARQRLMRDNPLGQGHEQTPVCVLRPLGPLPLAAAEASRTHAARPARHLTARPRVYTVGAGVECAGEGAPVSIVEVQELRKQYDPPKGVLAVDGVSFDIAEGEIFSLLGPNGAGKSTTISMLSCLLRPSGGDARVGGHSVVDGRRRRSRRPSASSRRTSRCTPT